MRSFNNFETSAALSFNANFMTAISFDTNFSVFNVPRSIGFHSPKLLVTVKIKPMNKKYSNDDFFVWVKPHEKYCF